jgi:hypothetical protein
MFIAAAEQRSSQGATMASTTKKGILERLSEGVVLGDGGYLLEL